MLARNSNIVRLLALAALGGCALVELPGYEAERTNQWASQGWTNADSHWFHHVSQGTSTFGLPFEWLDAMQQPELSPSHVGRFLDPDYLAHFGFVKSPRSLSDAADAAKHGYIAPARPSKYSAAEYAMNEHSLAVGFAVGGRWYDPVHNAELPIPGTGKMALQIGLTCAACHTGQLEYGKHRILIDGGAGMISLDKFREALAKSFALTLYLPWRFDEFARNVLGSAYNEKNKDALKEQYAAFFSKGTLQSGKDEALARLPNALVEGYARLDALNRIGNEVFQSQAGLDENLYAITAPVSFPPIWNAPWFDWVQYNSSIQQPMVRNLGEAMGVKGRSNLSHAANTFASRIPVRTLREIEELLAGAKHPLTDRSFGGLRSPKWTELPLPKPDAALAEKGRPLYDRICSHCHLPPVDSAGIFDPKHWRTVDETSPRQYLALVTIPAMEIGTDCRAAYEMAYRTVITPDFLGNSGRLVTPERAPRDCPSPPAQVAKPGHTITNFGVALGEIVRKTKDKWYTDNRVPEPERAAWDGFRPDPPKSIRASVLSRYPWQGTDSRELDLPVYKARPLNGVWATAPYLHNGSVPNLYLLLSPQKERDEEAATFVVGSREFDPVYVGFRYRADRGKLPEALPLASTRGLFVLDTSRVGNRNTGHLFTNDEAAAGRIGREFTPDERRAIIEYLKLL